MNERRIARIRQQIKTRIAECVQHELSDPRLGLITISRVTIDRELHTCRIYWTVLGDAAERRKNAQALDCATGFLRREVAAALHTRTVPRLQFLFDESIEGVQRMQGILDELRVEREEREGHATESPDPDESPTEP